VKTISPSPTLLDYFASDEAAVTQGAATFVNTFVQKEKDHDEGLGRGWFSLS
jgi:hypothetical protein